MPLRSICLTYFLIFICGFVSFSQEPNYILTLVNYPKGKRIQYEFNSPIMFNYQDTIIRDSIVQIDSNRILLRNNRWYDLSYIQTIYDTKGRSFFIQGAMKFPEAGLLFLMLTTINQGLAHGKPLIIREHLFPAIGLGLAGVIMIPFRYKKYHLYRKWELITIPS